MPLVRWFASGNADIAGNGIPKSPHRYSLVSLKVDLWKIYHNTYIAVCALISMGTFGNTVTSDIGVTRGHYGKALSIGTELVSWP